MRVKIPQGEIEVAEHGPQGAPVLVFVHGALVDGRLWKDVVPLLSRTYRCIVPDLPMGSHRAPMASDADLSPRGMARVVGALLDAMKLEDVTLIGSDTGGAVCQLYCASAPPRVKRLVLANCDALEVFPPPQFAYLRTIQKVPGLSWVAAKAMYLSSRRRRAFRAYGGLTALPVDDALLRSWVEPIAHSSSARRDLKKLILGFRASDTIAAADALAAWGKPVLLAWGTADPFFTVSLAERLAAKIPSARLEKIEGASTFVSLDQPERLVSKIAQFLGENAAVAMRA